MHERNGHGLRHLPGGGSCIMPKEGVFARVIRDGTIGTGNVVEIMKEGEEENHGKRG
ncbi:MAG TPA: hypothetical protein VII77_01115 [Candidatus Deferrimicrobium sp.]